MNNVYKWRLELGVYAFLCDETSRMPFVYNETTQIRIYATGEPRKQPVYDGDVLTRVSSMGETEYATSFNEMVTLITSMGKTPPHGIASDYYDVDCSACGDIASGGGLCPIIKIGDVKTGEYAEATIIELPKEGASNVYQLNLTLPKGDKGERGEQGEKGERGEQGEKGERGEQGEQGTQGEEGQQGETPESRFTSVIFKKSNTTPSWEDLLNETTSTYTNPLPPPELGWRDVIYGENNKVTWMSSKVFSTRDNEPEYIKGNWSKPVAINGSNVVDYAWCSGYTDYTVEELYAEGKIPLRTSPDEIIPEGHDANGWDYDFVSNAVWMAVRTIKGGEYIDTWVLSRVKGEDGKDGEKGGVGASVRGPIKWKKETRRFCNGVYNEDYPEDEKWIDIINVNGVTKRCKTSYNQLETQDWENVKENWEDSDAFNFIATDLLLAENAKINFLTGNEIKLVNEDGEITGGAKASDNENTVNFWAGAADPAKSPFQVNSNGSIIAEKGTFGCMIIGEDGEFGDCLYAEDETRRTGKYSTLVSAAGIKLKSDGSEEYSPYEIIIASQNRVLGDRNYPMEINVSSANRVGLFTNGIMIAGSYEKEQSFHSESGHGTYYICPTYSIFRDLNIVLLTTTTPTVEIKEEGTYVNGVEVGRWPFETAEIGLITMDNYKKYAIDSKYIGFYMLYNEHLVLAELTGFAHPDYIVRQPNTIYYTFDNSFTYSFLELTLHYSSDIKLLTNGNNWAYLSGYFCIYENGSLKSKQEIAYFDTVFVGDDGKYLTKSKNNFIKFNMDEYGTEVVNARNIGIRAAYGGVTSDIVNIALEPNKIEETNRTNELEVKIQEEEVPAYGGNINVSIMGYVVDTETYTSGKEKKIKKLNDPYEVDIYMGYTPHVKDMTFVQSAMTNNIVTLEVPENKNGSYRDVYVAAIYDFYDEHHEGSDYVYQDSYSMHLFYNETEITDGDVINCQGKSEIEIEDRGDNERDYNINIEGEGQSEIGYEIEDNKIYFFDIESYMNLSIVIEESGCGRGIRFILHGA